jgi:hypothetical protein
MGRSPQRVISASESYLSASHIRLNLNYVVAGGGAMEIVASNWWKLQK